MIKPLEEHHATLHLLRFLSWAETIIFITVLFVAPLQNFEMAKQIAHEIIQVYIFVQTVLFI